jgi:excisionase family DNA binding protein
MATTDHGMTIPEAAEALGVSERTVWRYLSSGRLSGETIGPVGQQRTLIDPGAVEVLRSGRGGNEARELRTRVEELSDQIAALRAESEQLRTALIASRREVSRLQKPVSRRAGDMVLAGLTSLASRRAHR